MLEIKRNCIPSHELDGVVMGMYLNILEYIDGEKEQEKLKEMIDLATTQKGIVAYFKEQGLNEGRNKILDDGKRQIISNLLPHHSLEEVARRLEMGENEIIRILRE